MTTVKWLFTKLYCPLHCRTHQHPDNTHMSQRCLQEVLMRCRGTPWGIIKTTENIPKAFHVIETKNRSLEAPVDILWDILRTRFGFGWDIQRVGETFLVYIYGEIHYTIRTETFISNHDAIPRRRSIWTRNGDASEISFSLYDTTTRVLRSSHTLNACAPKPQIL